MSGLTSETGLGFIFVVIVAGAWALGKLAQAVGKGQAIIWAEQFKRDQDKQERGT